MPIPGDPPLTQGMMDRYIDVWEWVLDLRLTDTQRARRQELWMDGFKKQNDKGKAKWRTDVKNNAEFWNVVAKMSETQRDLQRLQLQRQTCPPCGNPTTTATSGGRASTTRPTSRAANATPFSWRATRR